LVPVFTGVLGTDEPLPVCDGAAGPVGTEFISMVWAGTPPIAGNVILSSLVASSRAVSTGWDDHERRT